LRSTKLLNQILRNSDRTLFLPQLEGPTNHWQENGPFSSAAANDERSQRQLLGNLKQPTAAPRSERFCWVLARSWIWARYAVPHLEKSVAHSCSSSIFTGGWCEEGNGVALQLFNRARYRARPRPRSLMVAGEERGKTRTSTSTIWRGGGSPRISGGASRPSPETGRAQPFPVQDLSLDPDCRKAG
jgi:hypothetical protein